MRRHPRVCRRQHQRPRRWCMPRLRTSRRDRCGFPQWRHPHRCHAPWEASGFPYRAGRTSRRSDTILRSKVRNPDTRRPAPCRQAAPAQCGQRCRKSLQRCVQSRCSSHPPRQSPDSSQRPDGRPRHKTRRSIHNFRPYRCARRQNSSRKAAPVCRPVPRGSSHWNCSTHRGSHRHRGHYGHW